MKTLFAIIAAIGILVSIVIVVAMAVVDVMIDFDNFEYEDDVDEEF